LKNLPKEIMKIQKAEDYLDKEKQKLIENKEKLRIKLRKEREVLSLKNKIKLVKSRKK
jgi:hypothetical protein